MPGSAAAARNRLRMDFCNETIVEPLYLVFKDDEIGREHYGKTEGTELRQAE